MGVASGGARGGAGGTAGADDAARGGVGGTEKDSLTRVVGCGVGGAGGGAGMALRSAGTGVGRFTMTGVCTGTFSAVDWTTVEHFLQRMGRPSHSVGILSVVSHPGHCALTTGVMMPYPPN
jgi:hypothetical protein